MNFNKGLVFFLTFTAFCAVESSKSLWAYAKLYFQRQTGCSQPFLGLMDTTYLIFYGVSLKSFAKFGDKHYLKQFILLGMVTFPISSGLFSLYYLNEKNHNQYYLIGNLIFAAVLGSTIYPGFIATLGNWYQYGQKGLIIGLWSSCISIGNILGFLIGYVVIVELGYSWVISFLVSYSLILIMAVFLALFLKTEPEIHESLLISYESIGFQQETIRYQSAIEHDKQLKQMNLKQVLKIPGIIQYMTCFFFLKSTCYSVMCWLPIYLDDLGFIGNTAFISICFEVGIFIGSFGIGFISDKIGFRSLLMFPMIVIASSLFYILKYYYLKETLPQYFFTFLIGILLGGPQSLLSGTISIDYQNNNPEYQITSTLTGLIEGAGSIGSAIIGITLGFIPIHRFFIILSISSFLSGICIIDLFIKDIKEYKNQKLLQN